MLMSSIVRNNRCKMFFKKIIRNFIIFTGKHLCCSLILIKMQAIYIFFVWNTSSGCFCLVQVKGFLRFHKANSEVGFSWKVFSNKKKQDRDQKRIYRNSHLELFFKKGVFKHLAIIHRKTPLL